MPSIRQGRKRGFDRFGREKRRAPHCREELTIFSIKYGVSPRSIGFAVRKKEKLPSASRGREFAAQWLARSGADRYLAWILIYSARSLEYKIFWLL